ncbi:hypothetical protein RN001_014151 [Aquatica leii]|uniref:Uncharacterized protein n=1 Tax=Aquatica leii TaxID=1421715 RepID=A0AAN7P5F2_9COLE|nr:hypothetical protein RN001_014151 [Aquatica leii]
MHTRMFTNYQQITKATRVFKIGVRSRILGDVSSAPPCDCSISQGEQSCLLGHLIEVINKLVNCPRHQTTERPSSEDCSDATQTPSEESSTEDVAPIIASTTDQTPVSEYIETTSTQEYTEEETTPTTTTTEKIESISTVSTTTEASTCPTERVTEECPQPTLTNFKIPLPKDRSCDNEERSDFIYIPVLKVDDDTKPFDLANVLKCLFMRDKQ